MCQWVVNQIPSEMLGFCFVFRLHMRRVELIEYPGMKMKILYDRNKDRENILKASVAKNSKVPTSIQKLFIEQFGELFSEQLLDIFLEKYVKDNSVDIQEKVFEIENNWNFIKEEAIKRLNALFSTTLDAEITVYLTTDSRCTYNTDKNYFFVSFTSIKNSTNLIILHELFHFYTWKRYHQIMKDLGVSDDLYNDFKESLTILLNFIFQDLLDGARDEGYPNHHEMRTWIQNEYQKDKNLDSLVDRFVNKFLFQ